MDLTSLVAEPAVSIFKIMATAVASSVLSSDYTYLETALVATSPSCLIYANEEEGMVSQNTTVIFGGAFYLG
jgi:hypothetical protein